MLIFGSEGIVRMINLLGVVLTPWVTQELMTTSTRAISSAIGVPTPVDLLMNRLAEITLRQHYMWHNEEESRAARRMPMRNRGSKQAARTRYDSLSEAGELVYIHTIQELRVQDQAIINRN